MKNSLMTIPQTKALRDLKGVPFKRQAQSRLFYQAKESARRTLCWFADNGFTLWEVTAWSSAFGGSPFGWGIVAASDLDTAVRVAKGISMEGVIMPFGHLNCGPGHRVTGRRFRVEKRHRKPIAPPTRADK